MDIQTNVPVQNTFAPQQNHNEIPLSVILEFAIQRTYHQLTVMADMFPSTTDQERKTQLVTFACRTQQLFMRIYALVKFRRTANLNVSNILNFLDQQSFIFVDTADFLYNLAKVKLVSARLPCFAIPTAVDVLTLGTYPQLPTCIKERILPPEPIHDKDKFKTLDNLNRIIQCRLSLSDLPSEFHNFKIEKGHVKFNIQNEFEVMLTVMSDDYKLPWRLLFVKILVKNSQDPNRTLVHQLQVKYIHDVMQKRLEDSERPLVDLYNALHFFCQSLKFEVLCQQMNILQAITQGRFYSLDFSNIKQINVKYWLEYSRKDLIEFKFSILVNENHDLQTIHSPPLKWKDHKDVDNLFKSKELLIEKIIYQIIKIRSKRRLSDLQTKLASIPFCKYELDDDKPALKVYCLDANIENETILIKIQYYSGFYNISMPINVPTNLLNAIETCLNGDISKLEASLLKLRSFLILRRCELSLLKMGYICVQDLPISSFLTNDVTMLYNKLDKNRIFIELSRQEKIFIMVCCKNKDDQPLDDDLDFFDDEYAIRLNYFILKTIKCKFDGEPDNNSQYLKLISVSAVKRGSIINRLELDYIPSDQYTDELMVPKQKTETLYEVVKMISSLEERLPFLNFISTLNKQNIVTQSIQMHELLDIPTMSIFSAPKLDHKEFQLLGEELWSNLLSCTLRRANFSKHVQVQTGKTYTNKYHFCIEFKFQEQLFDRIYKESKHYDTDIGQSDSTKIESFILKLEMNKNSDNLFEVLKQEWFTMCRIYNLLRQLNNAFKQYPEMRKIMRIKYFDFKRLIVNYGPNFCYSIVFQPAKDNLNTYDAFLLTNNAIKPDRSDIRSFNLHFILINEIKKLLNYNPFGNVVELIQILNETCVPVQSLARISNFPKFLLPQTQLIPFPGFIILVESLTHIKLTYYNRFLLDVYFETRGLVTIKLSSFDTNLNLNPNAYQEEMQNFANFLNLFVDESVDEILRKKSDNENPFSPSICAQSTQITHQQLQQQQASQSQQLMGSQQQQHHVFLPPTSPAVRPQIPIPSPIHNVFAQSPGNVQPQSVQNQMHGIIPSPGVQSFGSPAVMPQSSPSSQMIPSQAPHAAQSPGGFLSPAPNYSIQSPANNYGEFSTQSPMSMPTKSPFNYMSSSNPGSILSNVPSVPQPKDNIDELTKPNASNVKTSLMSKKQWAITGLFHLSYHGFTKLLTPNPSNGFTPFETFITSNNMKKNLQRYLPSMKQHKFFEFKFEPEIQPTTYNAFSLRISPKNEPFQTAFLEEYFNTRILCPPYRNNSLNSFIMLLFIQDSKILKDFIQILEFENTFGWRIKICWTTPYGYQPVNPNSIASHYQTAPCFRKNETGKYTFVFYLLNPSIKNSPLNAYMCAYDTQTYFVQFEQLKQPNEPMNSDFDNHVTSIINQSIEMCKQRNDKNMLCFTINNLLNSLNQQRQHQPQMQMHSHHQHQQQPHPQMQQYAQHPQQQQQQQHQHYQQQQQYQQMQQHQHPQMMPNQMNYNM